MLDQTKITNRKVFYTQSVKPNIIIPEVSDYHRFVLGMSGSNPLVAICVNPSAANLANADSTVNKVAQASADLGYDGWFVTNIYPERATNSNKLDSLNKKLVAENAEEIRKLLRQYRVKEVWGAWGEPKHPNLKAGLRALLEMLAQEGIKVFAFQINQSGNPRHPLYLKIDPANRVEVDVSRLLHSVS